MARNVVQFQKGLSEPAFEREYGGEEQCQIPPASKPCQSQSTAGSWLAISSWSQIPCGKWSSLGDSLAGGECKQGDQGGGCTFRKVFWTPTTASEQEATAGPDSLPSGGVI